MRIKEISDIKRIFSIIQKQFLVGNLFTFVQKVGTQLENFSSQIHTHFNILLNFN